MKNTRSGRDEHQPRRVVAAAADENQSGASQSASKGKPVICGKTQSR